MHQRWQKEPVFMGWAETGSQSEPFGLGWGRASQVTHICHHSAQEHVPMWQEGAWSIDLWVKITSNEQANLHTVWMDCARAIQAQTVLLLRSVLWHLKQTETLWTYRRSSNDAALLNVVALQHLWETKSIPDRGPCVWFTGSPCVGIGFPLSPSVPSRIPKLCRFRSSESPWPQCEWLWVLVGNPAMGQRLSRPVSALCLRC